MDVEQGRSFGVLLRRHRETAGLTQEELAERAGLTANAIGALERAERRRPHPHTLRALADALELSTDARASFLASVQRREGDTPPPASPPVDVALPISPRLWSGASGR